MIGPTGAVRVLVATKAVDFRKGAKGLAALVRCRPSKSASSGPPVSPGTDRRNPRTDRPAWSREMVVDIDDHDRIGEDTGERLDIVPRSSACWSCVGPNMPAGLARTWWCRRRPTD